MSDWWDQWRFVFNRLWQERRRMFARVHKDKRQRALVLLAIGIVFYVAFYAVYLVHNPAVGVVLLLGAG